MSALLVLALALPIVSAGLAARSSGPTARSVVRGAGAGAAACWLLLLLAGGASAGPFASGDAVAAAGVGAGLALASITQPPRRTPALAAALAVASAMGGLAAGAGDGTAAEAVIGLLVAAAAVAVGARAEDDDGLLLASAGIGAAAVAGVGLALLASGTGSFALVLERDDALLVGTPILVGTAAVALASGLRPRRTGVVLLAPALGMVVPAGAVLAPWGEGMAIAAALTAVALLAVPVRMPRVLRLGPALVLWSAAAATVSAPGAIGAAWLLAAAAVIAATTLAPAAAAAALPGAAALGGALLAGGRPSGVVLAFLAAITAALVHPLRVVTVDHGVAVADGPATAVPPSRPARPPGRPVVRTRGRAAGDAGERGVTEPEPAAVAEPASGSARRPRRTEPLVAPTRRATASVAPSSVADASSVGRSWGSGWSASHRLGTVPALVLSTWLLVAPTTWGWVGPLALDRWTPSILAALGAAAVAVVVMAATGAPETRRPEQRLDATTEALDSVVARAGSHLEGEDPPSGPPDRGGATVALAVAALSTLVAMAALVASWPSAT